MQCRSLRGGWFALGIVLALWLPACAAQADEIRIAAIRFAGNEVTRESVLRQQLTIRVGEPLDPAAVETSRQAIMNLGLFTKVTDSVEQTPKGAVVTFTVHEKLYTWLLPRLGRNTDGDISLGGELRFDNLNGLDQRLKFIVEQKDIAGGGTELRKAVEFSAPRLLGTPYGLGLSLNETKRKETLYSGVEQGEYDRRNRSLALSLSRWLNRDGPNSGWHGDAGLSVSRQRYFYQSGTPGLAQNSQDVSVSLGAGYTRVNLRRYDYRDGLEYGGGASVGGPQIGADNYHFSLSGYLRRYLPMATPNTNLNYQLRAGYSNHAAAAGDGFSLGGADSLRGYERGSVTGDVYLLANVEYLRPLFGRERLRGVVFTDLGNAWSHSDFA
ncbi:BamA/TamA family outer membrane protein, partial [Acidihalobacter prosperus]